MFELQTSSLETVIPITTNQSVSTETEILTNKGSQCPHRLISQTDKISSHRNGKI